MLSTIQDQHLPDEGGRQGALSGLLAIFFSGYDRLRVTVAGGPVALTAAEYELLRVLALNAGRVMTHDTLLRRVWKGRRRRCEPGAHLRAQPPAQTR